MRPDPKPERSEKKAPKTLWEFRKAYGSSIKRRSRKGTSKYATARKQYLSEHSSCEVCGNLATEIHHKKGRSGELLYDKEYFLAVCRSCHHRIEMNPEWAKQKGYSVSRL